MARKSRRVRKSGQRPRLSAAQMVQPGINEALAEARLSDEATVANGSDLRAEYRYVVSDLRRIGMIAAVMLALLIVLAVALT